MFDLFNLSVELIEDVVTDHIVHVELADHNLDPVGALLLIIVVCKLVNQGTDIVVFFALLLGSSGQENKSADCSLELF